MNQKFKSALYFVAITWPLMMVAAYLLTISGIFSGTNLLVFGLLGIPALFIARLVTLQFFERPKT